MKINFFHVLILGVFGAVGVWVRYGLILLFSKVSGINIPIIIANLAGSFMIGFLTCKFSMIQQSQILLWSCVGFCGGLTTFSSLTLDVIYLLQQNRYTSAVIYASLSLLLGVLAVWIGFLIARL